MCFWRPSFCQQYHFTFIILSALIGSLTIGTTFFLSFLVGILSDKIGLRLTSVIGAVLATLGMGLSALLYRYLHNIYNIYTHIYTLIYSRISVLHPGACLYLTYGLMFGSGASLVYTPSLTILGGFTDQRLEAGDKNDVFRSLLQAEAGAG